MRILFPLVSRQDEPLLAEQLLAWQLACDRWELHQCVRISNLLQSIEMVRYDTRTKRVVILVGEETQLEILENGEVIIE